MYLVFFKYIIPKLNFMPQINSRINFLIIQLTINPHLYIQSSYLIT